jgi:hypothetical protein
VLLGLFELLGLLGLLGLFGLLGLYVHPSPIPITTH